MRIRLNTKADEVWIEFAGNAGTLGFGGFEGPGRSIEIPGHNGRGAVIEIDSDGFVRLIRVARLNDLIAELAPRSAKVGKAKP